MGRPVVPKPPRPVNNLRTTRPVRAPTPIVVKKKKPKKKCPNKECDAGPDVIISEDGACTECGTIVNDVNIVNEQQFAEGGNGQTVAVGSFLAADQGAGHMSGAVPRGAQVAVKGAQSSRTAMGNMRMLQAKFKLPEGHVTGAMNLYKLATAANFVQGRRIDLVAAACLYTYCRTVKPCKVMLIDFSDTLSSMGDHIVTVFQLGTTYKNLHSVVALKSQEINPILPEDLIHRFAEKLEFGTPKETNKVAEDAIRLAQRMSLDWMVMGRRPAGVCGACLILAARMNNFRRTINEVVFVVKVTQATIQKRLDEFKLTPSASMSIDDFQNNELLPSQHDPPSFYKKQDPWLAAIAARKRKRATRNGKIENPDGSGSATVRRDADGFAIPNAPPSKKLAAQREKLDIVDQVVAAVQRGEGSLDPLIETFGRLIPEDEEDTDEAMPINSPEGWIEGVGGVKATIAELHDAGVDLTEDDIRPDQDAESQVNGSQIDGASQSDLASEHIADPDSEVHDISYNVAKQKVDAYMQHLKDIGYWKEVSDSQDIDDTEFADDPEVANCELPPAVQKIKSDQWHKKHKGWMFKQQEKEFAAIKAANGPAKKTRKRQKRAKIGEGTGPASTPTEAADNMMKKFMFSKKLNYNKFEEDMFGSLNAFGSRAQGSPGTSRATSVAPSTLNSDQGDREASEAPSIVRDGSATPSATGGNSPAASDADADLGDVEEEEQEETTHLQNLLRRHAEPNAEEDEEPIWNGTYDDGGGDEIEGFEQDDAFDDGDEYE